MKGVTAYQLEVLRLAAAGVAEGAIDFDQLLEALSWKPTKESAQFTIRALVTKGLLEKAPLELRRGRRRVTYRATLEGRRVLDPRLTISAPKTFVPGVDDSPVEDLSFEGEDVVVEG